MKLHFMKYRKLSYWVSGLFVVLSILSLFTRGLNYGIDFAGGIAMEITPKSADYTIDKMRSDLVNFKPELQSIDDNKSILVRVGLPKGATDEQQNQRVREIKNILGDRVDYSHVQIVGPKIGGELVRGGIWAILVSFILMSIYIWIQYRGGYAVGSFVSLILDFVLMFGFFSIMGLEFNQTSIAVILMGIGYSINDKVVNYDRIEENINKYHKMPMTDLVDLSVNEMLRRTVMTSVSTLLAMVGLYAFGGSILRDFSVAMIFAIIMGTLTSIYISNVILYHFNLRKMDSK
ncbi:MAG: protein translocase subunit SecF [Alphaproteobacteria bacterium]|nr:protein translocase subunit SecF [Alphaproteobacteria bacterium]MBN2675580.1 protein translocase subunit SecF [Alphaproteobacteria bacterium]